MRRSSVAGTTVTSLFRVFVYVYGSLDGGSAFLIWFITVSWRSYWHFMTRQPVHASHQLHMNTDIVKNYPDIVDKMKNIILFINFYFVVGKVLMGL